MLFLFVFGIITCVFILKQLFAEGSVIIGEYHVMSNSEAKREFERNVTISNFNFDAGAVAAPFVPDWFLLLPGTWFMAELNTMISEMH